ncbi:hypothetical protein BB170200_01639 [Mycobacterium marinum]|nr:hypothetical protein BB170200_01639 [Mycobacterium marinum]
MVQPRSNAHSNLDALKFSRTADNKESAIDALRAFAPTQPEEADVDLRKPSISRQRTTKQRNATCSR